MKRFRFRLERILELKKYSEKQWEIKLGEITVQCENIKREMKETGDKRRISFADRPAGKLEDMAVTEAYINHLDGKLKELRGRLDILEKKRLEVQKKYLEASKERKVYDALKEKRAAEFHKEELRREFMEIDDLNSGTAARKAEGRNGCG